MWTLSRPVGRLTHRRISQRHGWLKRSALTKRNRVKVEKLETRSLCSVGGHELAVSGGAVHHHAEVRTLLPEAIHAGPHIGALPAAQIHSARKKQPSFTLAQEEKFLQGKWVVTYDASSLFGPGAEGAQELVLTGTKSTGQFSSITGVSVVGFFGLRSYYQFGSWGYYQFLNKKLVRLTITGASPTEYLNSGIIVMDGQSMPIQFSNKNQFVVDGQTYNREPLNQTIFNQ
jgi:hypothetical protein